ncbi:hypothetical protein GMD78_17845 [Ornithinibacillus sp. L9]|uniref:Uncharacterized protein n=1 Tax=Ornithinibacillus caprae TaxID=2678566 RepID=A0A6N8FQD9_9BACI|nr:hypothetical protein [Ornithinibacillus caprae]MUK90239.1 hypothetical protein [Ornithinibacillus caprae]
MFASKVFIIKMAHLRSLGLTEEILFSLLILVGIIASYMVIKPITTFLISLKSTRLLSYLLSSLVFIVLFFIVVFFIGEIQFITFRLFKFALQALAVFGGMLLIMHVYQQLLHKKGMKKSVR